MPLVSKGALGQNARMSILPNIPVIDLTRENCIAQLREAYGEIGFGYITGHGIDPSLVRAVFEASVWFHNLPIDQKMALAVNAQHRGYIPINTSTDVKSDLAEVTKPNQSASFMVMREDAAVDPATYLSGPNQWPDAPDFRATLERYVAEMSALGRRLMGQMLEAAKIEDRSILSAFDTPTTWLRLLHYPPVADHAPGDLYGSAPHRDFGALTFLAQDEVGGLQVQTRDGDWIDAPYIEGTFVVNVGDMLARLTNDRLISTPHRVINRSGRERYSCPFFFDPHVSTMIAPIAGTGEPNYPPLHFGDFLRGELEASYDAHKGKTAP